MTERQKPFVPKNAVDFQKLKLDKLMANPDKPVLIPDMPKDRKGYNVPEFVRNVMGSSAGAGSGEFHVYRHLRRKEYTRQKIIDEKNEKEKLDSEFQEKLEANRRRMEERTAKKRAKRLRLKENKRKKKSLKGNEERPKTSSESSESESSEKETVSLEDNTPQPPLTSSQMQDQKIKESEES